MNKEGATALMVASEKGDVESVKLLHAMKADVNICGESGTAMHFAALGGQAETLKVTSRYAHPPCMLRCGSDLTKY